MNTETAQTMTDTPRKISRALLSASDKTGIVDFARALAAQGIELISTGGTARTLADAGLRVIDVAELTGFPEMMDGRVKTLHPSVHGGLLAIRHNADHVAAMQTHSIRPIDLLVVNLYPFEATVAKDAGFDECVENVDIGGPAMIRAAAKNHADVAVVVEPEDYAALLAELSAHAGSTTLAFRKRLAAKAYARTAAYDAAISNWFADALGDTAPAYRTIGGRLVEAHHDLSGHVHLLLVGAAVASHSTHARSAQAGLRAVRAVLRGAEALATSATYAMCATGS